MSKVKCPSCKQHHHSQQMIAPQAILPSITKQLKAKNPDLSDDEPVCELCVNKAMADDAEDMLKVRMKGDLTTLERDVIESLRQGDMIPQNVAKMDEDDYLSLTERIADRVANTIGSFSFASLVLICVVMWLLFGVQSGLMTRHPMLVFGGLSSVLGALAAVQNPIILMSQRRATKRDSLRNENDYRVNLKSELEVRYINAKLDYMMEKIARLHHDN